MYDWLVDFGADCSARPICVHVPLPPALVCGGGGGGGGGVNVLISDFQMLLCFMLLYQRLLYQGSAPYIFFAGQTNVACYARNIIIPKIIKPGFHCTHI